MIDKELELEGLMLQRGIDRDEKTHEYRVKALITNLFAPRILERFVKWFPGMRGAYKDVAPLFEGLRQRDILSLIVAALETLLSKNGYSRTGLVRALGHAVLQQASVLQIPPKTYQTIWEYARVYKPHIVHRILRENAKRFAQLPDVDAFRVGLLFYALFKEAGLIEEMHGNAPRRRTIQIFLKPQLEQTLLRHRWVRPQYLPMVVPPLDWKLSEDGEVLEGGYYTLPDQLIHGFRKEFKPQPGLWLAAVNRLQAVPYRINTEMLEFFKECLAHRWLVASPPDFYRKPEKPQSDDPMLRKEFKYRMREYYANVARSKSLWLSYFYTRNIAEDYAEYDRIYFPAYVDFRGRVYYNGSFLNPQGCDFAKALLEFAEPRRITTDEGLRALKIYVAGLYGYGRRTYAERLQWFEEHEDLVLEVAKRPTAYIDVIEQADEPFRFVAACKAYAKALAGEPTGFIVQIDGSNNGTQHVSAMLGVNNKYVNMTSEERYYDFYSEVARRVTELIADDTDIKNQRAKLFWLEKGITRDLVKRNSMTYVYSVTFPGMVDQNLHYIIKEHGLQFFEGYNVFEIVNYLTTKIYEALKELGSLEFLRWLQQIVAKIDAPLEWITPSGFVVSQAYRRTVVYQIATFFGKRKLSMRYHDYTEKLHKKKMKLGISPNFVHSYDAAHLALIVNRCDFPLLAQHDSFGTYPDHIPELHRIIRETFVEIYSKPVLLQHKTEWERRYGVRLPDPPIQGELNCEEILRAPYFFS
jgi:DNA-directed RNA polymerase